MSKQLDFFSGAYLSEEAIQKNPRAETDLEHILNCWDSGKRFLKVSNLENLFSKFKEILIFPITVTQVNFNCNSSVSSFICTDGLNKTAKIELCSSSKELDLSLEVFIEAYKKTIHSIYVGDLSLVFEEITIQVGDKTIKKVYDVMSKFDDPTRILGKSIKIITKDNIVFQIQPNAHMDNNDFIDFFNEYSQSFCYDNIDTAEQLYIGIREKFKNNSCCIQISELIDGKEHIRSSYYARNGKCHVFGEYFEENKGCLQVSVFQESILIEYYKNGGIIIEIPISPHIDIEKYIKTKISIETLDKIGDLGLIQRQINDNFKRICSPMIIGHRFEKNFREKLNMF